MANSDFARGLWPVGHLSGGVIATRPYILTTGEIIRKGEVVKVVTGGTVEDSTAADGAIVVGVSADFVDDSASVGGKIVNIYDDPNIIFAVQVTTAATASAASVFKTSDLQTCSKSGITSASQVSDTELLLDTQGQVKIIGLLKDVDNAWGQHAKVLVIFNEHLYKYPVAAV